MGAVRVINDNAQFNDEMANVGTKLVVVDFTATWCRPCQTIAPVFEQLSLKYPKAVFLKVDVDKCAETAAGHGVIVMPTFIFFRNRTKLGLCQGADPVELELKIRKFYNDGDAEGSAGAVCGEVRNTDNVYYHIFGMIFLAAVLYYWNKYQ